VSEHTSGPWRWLPGDHLVGDAGRTTIIRDGAGVYNATEGDKLLIAAAPEMLSALRGLIDIAEGRTSDVPGWKQIDLARAAIAKAEGGT